MRLHTSLPGDRAWFNVQSGKAGDLFFSQSGGISLFNAQFLNKYRKRKCNVCTILWTVSQNKCVTRSLTFSLLIWMGENFLCPPLSGTRRLYRAYIQTENSHNPFNTRKCIFFNLALTKSSTNLVRLCRLMEHASIDGSSHQVVGSGDGVDVTGEMEVELK